MNQPGPLLVSIIVCTRNRAEKLLRTLQAIAKLDVPPQCNYELLVVDNGSTDETANVCRQMQAELKDRLRILFIAAPGLSRAGNFGYEAAYGDIISFLDDDVLPRHDWLTVIHQEFSTDAELGAISGRVELLDPSDLPTSVRRQTERVEFQRLADAFNLFIGCNLVIRRELVQRLGLFDPDLGTGTRFGSAGDSDFAYRAWKAGEKLVYIPSLFVYHDHGRKTSGARLKLARVYVIGRGAFYAKHIMARDWIAAKHMYWELISACRSLFDRRDEFHLEHPALLLKGFLGYIAFRLVQLFSWRHDRNISGRQGKNGVLGGSQTL